MKRIIASSILAAFICLVCAIAPVIAAVYYVDVTNGDDSNSGLSSAQPWKSLSKITNFTFHSGDSVLLKRGERWAERLSMDSSGKVNDPITIGAYGSGDLPKIRSITLYGNFIIVEDIIVDANKESIDAVRVTGAQNCILRRLRIQNGTKDGIDADRANGLLVDSCLIHHFLGGSFTEQKDAHGIVVTRSQGITVHNTEIHQVSGDSFQADPARDSENLTNDILIENCHFWTGPLTENFNSGWKKTDHLPDNEKQYPGENAIDTKVLSSGWDTIPRMRITLKDVLAHGWKKDGYISNKAVFNLKEKVDALLDGITVYDSEIAFRIRGTRGNANVRIKNAVIYNCEKAIRAENNLENLKIYNSTFGDSIGDQLIFAGGSGGTGTWDFRNNAFVENKPDVAYIPSNVVVMNSELDTNFIDTVSGNYHINSGSKLIEIGETLASVTIDRDGKNRTSPYDVGAYEFSTEGGPVAPSPPKNLRIVN